MNLFTIPDELLNSDVILFSGPESSRRLVPKYIIWDKKITVLEIRREKSSTNIKHWGEKT